MPLHQPLHLVVDGSVDEKGRPRRRDRRRGSGPRMGRRRTKGRGNDDEKA